MGSRSCTKKTGGSWISQSSYGFKQHVMQALDACLVESPNDNGSCGEVVTPLFSVTFLTLPGILLPPQYV